ncbi:IS110 family transposase [Hydrogenophaga sp. BPS33]|uniref:IS110 family transposase n=1 Tax=Hydrogenophaga sp. BPS33 TaxID=2651974 RepID=UPI00131F7EFD|nr:transposase [Hydrogenophaga sp. BPS33]QHE85081.1 IS110 family transposase [Hydrogenophaga sp. BPS33]QHE85348.1 IS110 family transposase [Hydrogenophaga sp. BPS33]
MTSSLGVDVSKAKLDVALLNDEGKYRCKVFANSGMGFAALHQWLQTHLPQGQELAALHVCMEATGSYHEPLALHLHDLGVRVSVVNPLRVKRFIELEGTRNKTDQGDSKSLARFCRMASPELWEAPAPGVRALQALVARLDALQEMRQSEANRLEVAHGVVQASLHEMLATLDKTIAQVKAQIRQTIDDDPHLRGRAQLLHSIPGLGDRTIPQLLAYIGRPERFKSVKALIAYASLSPAIRQSGTSLNKRGGTHAQGHRQLKHALYFPAMVAGRHNPAVAAFWQRLKAQNKPGKVIVVACMHKLLAIVYGVLKSRTPFDATRFCDANT